MTAPADLLLARAAERLGLRLVIRFGSRVEGAAAASLSPMCMFESGQ